jgi:addiction module RelE/StbE family toxin
MVVAIRRIRVVVKKGFAARYKGYAKQYPAIRRTMHTFNEVKRKIPPEPLPPGMNDNQLQGKWKTLGLRECHLAPNVLLFYRQSGNLITLITIGTHDDLSRAR